MIVTHHAFHGVRRNHKCGGATTGRNYTVHYYNLQLYISSTCAVSFITSPPTFLTITKI